MEVFTIGFTKKSAAEFFDFIKRAGIKRLIDVRLNNTKRRVSEADEVILSVGLSRPFASSRNVKPLHWLHVNNIHCKYGFL